MADYKLCSLFADGEDFCSIISVAFKSVGNLYLTAGIVSDIIVIVVQHYHTILGQAVRKLEFGLYDIFHRLEHFKMCRAYRGDYAVLRVYDVADLLYLTHALCSHFAEEYFVSCIKTASYHLYNAHCGIIAFRSHKNTVFCRKKLFEIELCTCLAVATCKTYYRKVGKLLYNSLCIVYIVAVYACFYRLIDNVCDDSAEEVYYLHKAEDYH